jgi:hypothetical protein
VFPAQHRLKAKRVAELHRLDSVAWRSREAFQPVVSRADANLCLLTIAGSLKLKHFGVALAALDQIGVASLFGNFAVFKDQNSISHPDG